VKLHGLVRPEEHFCQQMLARYDHYNTIFVGQAGAETELSQPWQRAKKYRHSQQSAHECVASDFYSNSLQHYSNV